MLTFLFSIGFRPFFLAAAWMAVLWMGAWTGFLLAGVPSPGSIPPLLWHGHEMLFGFTAAVIAGFLLTAVQNWTGLRSVTPAQLAGLAALWFSARLGFLFPELLPLWLTSVLDLAFLPMLAVVMARVLLKAGNRRNYAFIPLLAALTLLNGAVHLELHGLLAGIASWSIDVSILLITVLLVFMGGRVIPFFTERRLPAVNPRQWPWLNWSSTLSVLGVALVFLIVGRDPALAPILIIAGTLTLARLLAWRPWRVLREPLLWILHLGYAWIPVGLGLQAAHLLGVGLPWSAGVHALMVGAMSTLCLGMMARVALGHSGREMVAPQPVVVGFVLISVAALGRVLISLPVGPGWLLGASGLLWSAAFLLYAIAYTPILMRPRAA